jgi:hypothetical protein
VFDPPVRAFHTVSPRTPVNRGIRKGRGSSAERV